MKFWPWLVIGVFTWVLISSYFTYEVMLNAEPTRFLTNNQTLHRSTNQHETIKVEGVEYLVVETNNGVGVTLKLNKSNLKKLASMVSEISDEMDSEQFNSIIQK